MIVSYTINTPDEIGHVEAYKTLREAKQVAKSIASGSGKDVSVWRHERHQYSDRYQIVFTAKGT